MKGFEPPTYGLQIRCSTIELHQHFYLSYGFVCKSYNTLRLNIKKSNNLEKIVRAPSLFLFINFGIISNRISSVTNFLKINIIYPNLPDVEAITNAA